MEYLKYAVIVAIFTTIVCHDNVIGISKMTIDNSNSGNSKMIIDNSHSGNSKMIIETQNAQVESIYWYDQKLLENTEVENQTDHGCSLTVDEKLSACREILKSPDFPNKQIQFDERYDSSAEKMDCVKMKVKIVDSSKMVQQTEQNMFICPTKVENNVLKTYLSPDYILAHYVTSDVNSRTDGLDVFTPDDNFQLLYISKGVLDMWFVYIRLHPQFRIERDTTYLYSNAVEIKHHAKNIDTDMQETI